MERDNRLLGQIATTVVSLRDVTPNHITDIKAFHVGSDALLHEIDTPHAELSEVADWTCPGLVDTWVKLPPRPVRAVARTLAD